MKRCGTCKVLDPECGFYKRWRSKDGLSSRCKSCTQLSFAKTAEDNPKQRANIDRKSSLKHRYGLTPEQYDALLISQDGRCAICERPASDFKMRLAVDHSHATGAIRGLLCNFCNHKIVGKHTDGEKFRAIANYIESETGLFAPRLGGRQS